MGSSTGVAVALGCGLRGCSEPQRVLLRRGPWGRRRARCRRPTRCWLARALLRDATEGALPLLQLELLHLLRRELLLRLTLLVAGVGRCISYPWPSVCA